MELKEIYNIFQKYPIICSDTRFLMQNSIFIALKGENFNGNHFAEYALQNGAQYAIVDEKQYAKNEKFILVDDALKTLQLLALYHRRILKIPIIAITGTNGKTTTKELISAVLKEKYHITFTKGNLNNHIGVPLTLLSMTKLTEIGVVEMGANHPGEINSLCKIAEPDFGIITNIGKAHLEGFGSFEGVIKTKTELYKYIRLKNGLVFLNTDNEILSENIFDQPVYTYGTKGNENITGKYVKSDPYLSFIWKREDDPNSPISEFLISTQLAGAYNLENALTAICVGSYFDIQPELIKNAIENYKPENNRSQILKTSNNTLLCDFYNANPTSLEAAISNFVQINSKNKVLILGDMLELGESSEEEHKLIIEIISKNSFKEVYLVGEYFTSIINQYGFQKFKKVDLLIELLRNNPISNSFILIKGSRGIKLERVLEVL